MTGKLYIDGKDAYDRYRVLVHQNGYTGVVAYPPLKKVESVEWPGEDGLDVDLGSPVLDTRQCRISFACTDNNLLGDFMALISDRAYHLFDFRAIKLAKRLRLVSQQSNSSLFNLETFSLQFADDKPLEGYVYKAPIGNSGIWQRGHEIDGRDLSQYGVWVLKGSHDQILKSPAVKLNQIITNGISPGSWYDGQRVVFKSKDVTLSLCARANSLADFWHNYNALLYDLVRPGERVFYYENTGEEYPCYYKSSNVSNFTVLPGGGVWCDFSLTLVFSSFRIGETDYLLSTESEELVVTEDDEYYIDLRYGN